MLILLAALTLSNPTSAAGADEVCTMTIDNTELARMTANGFQLFDELEIDGLQAHVSTMKELLPCLTEIVQPRVIADSYVLFGVEAFTRQDTADVDAFFASARLTNPGYDFPGAGIVDNAHPLRQNWSGAVIASPSISLINDPGDGLVVMIDGIRGVSGHTQGTYALVQTVKPGTNQPTHTQLLSDIDLASTSMD